MGWEPIAGSSAVPFRATLRGNRYGIANLYIRRGAAVNYHSILGVLGSNGRVESLALTDADILTTSPTRFAGGIAGQSNGSVTASFNQATVVGSTSSQVGGIAGRNQG